MKYESEFDDPIMNALKTAYFSKLSTDTGKYNKKRELELDDLEKAIRERKQTHHECSTNNDVD